MQHTLTISSMLFQEYVLRKYSLELGTKVYLSTWWILLLPGRLKYLTMHSATLGATGLGLRRSHATESECQ